MKEPQTKVLVDEKLICSGCVGEEFLKAEIRKSGEQSVCSYCGKIRKTISITDLADEFDGAFERHFYRTSTEPNDYEYMLLKDRESSYDFERHGEPVLDVIQEIGDVSKEIADDLLETLGERHGDYERDKMGEENDFDSESYYSVRKTSIADLYSQWGQFERSAAGGQCKAMTTRPKPVRSFSSSFLPLGRSAPRFESPQDGSSPALFSREDP